MRTYLRWALRVAAVLGFLLILTLAAGLIWPELVELPESWLAELPLSAATELRMHAVHGTITLDGQPLDEGEIRFVHASGKFNPDVGKVRKGKYVVQVKEGEHKVEIRLIEAKTQLPARYNLDTELRFQATEAAEQNFQLRSTGK